MLGLPELLPTCIYIPWLLKPVVFVKADGASPPPVVQPLSEKRPSSRGSSLQRQQHPHRVPSLIKVTTGSSITAGAMANIGRREALRGAEAETFDLLAEVLTPETWAELLQAPLKRAAENGNRGFAQKPVRAGAEIGGALHMVVREGQETW